MTRASFIRSLLVRGTGVIASTLSLLCIMSWHGGESTGSEASQLTTTTTAVTTMATTTATTTTATTTTTTTVSATTTTESKPVVIETTTSHIATQPATTTQPPTSGLPITQQEFTLIANVISHEAGCSWIGEYERACIVACIMNRVADPRFPNTIDAVVHQRGQMFDVPYYRVDYSGIGYAPIDNAIYAYFSGKYSFGNIESWSGNGRNNTFY